MQQLKNAVYSKNRTAEKDAAQVRVERTLFLLWRLNVCVSCSLHDGWMSLRVKAAWQETAYQDQWMVLGEGGEGWDDLDWLRISQLTIHSYLRAENIGLQSTSRYWFVHSFIEEKSHKWPSQYHCTVRVVAPISFLSCVSMTTWNYLAKHIYWSWKLLNLEELQIWLKGFDLLMTYPYWIRHDVGKQLIMNQLFANIL